MIEIIDGEARYPNNKLWIVESAKSSFQGNGDGNYIRCYVISDTEEWAKEQLLITLRKECRLYLDLSDLIAEVVDITKYSDLHRGTTLYSFGIDF